ncbi:MAG: phosphate-starvation-inducible PsiE family protein [Lysobacterales bacterium]|mgnify:CR=1 FL=1
MNPTRPLQTAFHRGIQLLERGGLILITAATVIAGAMELYRMLGARAVTVVDLLLLFIYLEMISMVEIYWRMGKLPVRMPLYIAMVGIARHLMADSAYHSPWLLLAGAGAIVLLGVAVLIVRYGHLRWPYPESESLDRQA